MLKPLGPGEGSVDVLGLEAVAAELGGLQGPAETGVRQHRKEEGTDELSVGEPDRPGEVGTLDGEEVDEDWVDALKEYVQRGGIFEDPTFLEKVGTQTESQFGSGEPKCGGPLPRVGGEGDAGMEQEKRPVD